MHDDLFVVTVGRAKQGYGGKTPVRQADREIRYIGMEITFIKRTPRGKPFSFVTPLQNGVQSRSERGIDGRECRNDPGFRRSPE